MFRSAFISSAFGLLAGLASAQRPVATLISSDLLRLDLDGIRLFADAPVEGPFSLFGPEDIVLFPLDPDGPVAGGRTFMPSMEGELLERRTERLGEKTAIFVFPRSTPYGDRPHYSYLVQWNGRRIWFSGLTESITELMAMSDLDLVFLNPAQYAALLREGKRISARAVMVYHRAAEDTGETPVPCDRCKVLRPAIGETITLFR